SQCSRPLSPLLPSVPAEPFTTLPPLPCCVFVSPPWAAASAGTKASEAATSSARLMDLLTIGILQIAYELWNAGKSWTFLSRNTQLGAKSSFMTVAENAHNCGISANRVGRQDRAGNNARAFSYFTGRGAHRNRGPGNRVEVFAGDELVADALAFELVRKI